MIRVLKGRVGKLVRLLVIPFLLIMLFTGRAYAAITYNPDTNTIIIVGDESCGNSETNPCTFEDIYQADQQNGWGVFTKLSENVYKTTAKLQCGDGSTETWFEEKGTTLIIENTASKTNDIIVLFKANCNAKFGEYIYIEDADDYVVKNGVIFLIRETNYDLAHFKIDSGSNVEFYGCGFYRTADSKEHLQVRGYVKKFIGCAFNIGTNLIQNAVVRNCVYNGGGVAEYINSDIRGLTAISYVDYLIWAGANPIEVRNSVFIVSDRLLDTRIKKGQVNKFINCKSNKWVVRWLLNEGEESGETQRIYAVRFKVTDVNRNPLANREVKVYDKNGNKIAEAVTDSNGLTPEVEILYAKLTNPYSDGKWHTFTDEDWEYFNPFTVEVWYGNELEFKGILTDLDVDSTYIQITVKPSSLTLTDVLNEIQTNRNMIEYGIIDRETIHKIGSTIKVRFRSASNDTVRIIVYSPSGDEVVNDTMEELGDSGIYYYDLTFNTSWGTGDFLIICKDENMGIQDAMSVMVLSEDEWWATQAAMDTVLTKLNAISAKIDDISAKADQILSNQTKEWDKLIELQNNITAVYNEVINMENQLQQVNQTLYDEILTNRQYLEYINQTVNETLNEIKTVVEPKIDSIKTYIEDNVIPKIDTLIQRTDCDNHPNTPLCSHVLSIESDVSCIKTKVDEMDSAITNMNDTVNDKLDAIYVRTGYVLDNLTTLSNYVTGDLTNLVNDIKNDINGTVIPTLNDISSDVGYVKTKVDEIYSELDNLTVSVTGMRIRVTSPQTVLPDSVIRVDVVVTDLSGQLIDPDSIIVRVYDPTDRIFDQGSPIRISTGQYYFKVYVGEAAVRGQYKVEVLGTWNNITTKGIATFRVEAGGPYDVVVEVENDTYVIGTKEICADVKVYNFGDIGQDVRVHYWIDTEDYKTISSSETELYTPPHIWVERTLCLPAPTKEGLYYFKVRVYYGEGVTKYSHDTFKMTTRALAVPPLSTMDRGIEINEIATGILIVLASSIIATFIVYHRKAILKGIKRSLKSISRKTKKMF